MQTTQSEKERVRRFKRNPGESSEIETTFCTTKACLSVAEAATNAHIVLEAVPDKLEIKSKVFAEAVSTARPGAILATNTLSIPLKNIQEARAIRRRAVSAWSLGCRR